MNLTIEQMIQFIQAVEQYYNNAWNKLIIVGAIIVGAGAIGLPLVIQYWQQKGSKLSMIGSNLKSPLM